jgi:hypothetical protein
MVVQYHVLGFLFWAAKKKNFFYNVQNIKDVGRIQMLSRYMKNQGRM